MNPLTRIMSFCQKGKRRLHRLLISLLPDTEYKRKWQNYYHYWWRFGQCGYTLCIENGKIYVFNELFSIVGESANTIWTAFGVFCEREYEFFDDRDYLMIDVGLNIGITSLWFSAKENIRKIYGYEPFPQTFQQAAANLKRHPNLKSKIEIFNFGLGNADQEVAVHYNPDFPGSMSTVKDLYQNIKKTPEHVQIRSAAAVLKPIFEQNPELRKFLKIDCEGAEMEILENLSQSGLLSQVSLILLEWHFGCVQEIVEILSRNGFVVICRHTVPGSQGNIAAFTKCS